MRLLPHLLVLVAYFALGTLIAYASRRYVEADSRSYFVAGYRLSGFLSAMTYAATSYSAFMMVGLVGLSYATGVGAFGFEIMYFIATLALLTLFAERVWRAARERRWVTPAEMLGDLYKSTTLRLGVALLSLIALIPYASAQLVGIGSLFTSIVGSYEIGVFAGAVIVVLWTLTAGIWSVASTDAFQGLWMLIAALSFITWIVLYVTQLHHVPLPKLLEVLSEKMLLGLHPPWSLTVFLAYTIPWIFFAVTNPQVVQRIYMPRDDRALRRMILLFAVFGLIYTVIVTLSGLIIRGASELGLIPLISNRDMVTPYILNIMNPLLAAFIFTSIVAAAVSTMDSIILTLASSTAHDIVKEHKAAIRYLTIIALTLLTLAFSLLRLGFIVELSVLSSILLLPLAPITLFAWCLPDHVKGLGVPALLSIVLGDCIVLAFALTKGIKSIFTYSLLGFIPIPLLVLVTSTAVLLAGLVARNISRDSSPQKT